MVLVEIKKIAEEIKKKLMLLSQAECSATLIQKQGDKEQLGISDTGQNTKQKEYEIRIILITRGSDKNAIGELQNAMELGNNPEEFLEFIRLVSDDGSIMIQTGNRIRYLQKEYMVIEVMPIVMGGELLLYQYTAKKVL